MTDKSILRRSGNVLAAIAALPIQRKKRGLWVELNGLRKTRPMVTIDQLPWHELNKSDEMKLFCEDKFLRSVEYSIKQLLYRWNHFPADMVIENRINIPMSITGLKYGIDVVEETIGSIDGNSVVSHRYHDEIPDEDALNRLENDKITVDRKLDEKHLDILGDIFNDIIPIRLKGVEIHGGFWDRIAQMRPADKILWDIIDKPEFTKKIVNKFVSLTMSTIDQCEKLGILDANAQYIHCTGAYTDELPSKDYNPLKPKSQDCWLFGMSQIFSTVSPKMHDEFEIDMAIPIFERFGLGYYGCCEPLQKVIPYIRKLPNVRKISCSPWADIDKSAELIAGDYVYSCKPNPSFIATGHIDRDAAEEQISHVLKACSLNNTNSEFILKDISTVSGNIEVIDEWEKLAMGMVDG